MMCVQMSAGLMWIWESACFPHLWCPGVAPHQGSLATDFHPVVGAGVAARDGLRAGVVTWSMSQMG